MNQALALGRRIGISKQGLFVINVTLIVVWLTFAAEAILLTSGGLSDFSVFYSAAATLRDHSGSIYDLPTIVATAQRHDACALFPHPAYLYPPLLAILLLPLASLPCSMAIHIWIVLQLALWAGSAALMVLWLRYFWSPGPVTITIGLVFSLLCWPLASGLMQFAQVDALILFCLLLAPWLIAHGHPKLGGSILVFAAMIKVVPALLIGFYLLRGRWRVVIGALLCGGLLLAFQALVVGLPELFAMRSILANSSLFVTQADNFSLLHAPVWTALIFGVPIPPSTQAPGYVLVAVVAITFVLITCGSRGWLSSRLHSSETRSMVVHTDSDEKLDLLGYAWAVSVMLLLTPLVWLHYLAWLLVPLAFCGGYVMGVWRTRGRAALLGLLVAGYMLATLRLPLLYDTTPEYVLGPYVGTYGLRPLMMITHPLGQVMVAAACTIVFAGAAGLLNPLPSGGDRTVDVPVAPNTHNNVSTD